MKKFLLIQRLVQISFVSLITTLVLIYLPLSIYIYNQAQKAGIEELSSEYFDLYSQANSSINYLFILAIIPFVIIFRELNKRYSKRSLLYEQVRKEDE